MIFQPSKDLLRRLCLTAGLSLISLLFFLIHIMNAPGCSRLPNAPARTPEMTLRGITLAEWSAWGYGSQPAFDAIDEIHAAGANTITFIITAYQSTCVSSRVRIDAKLTPRMPSVAAAVSRWRTHEGRAGIMIKPHVDLDDEDWRGFICPDNPDEWFRSYRAFVLPWAAFAETTLAAQQFVIGTELAGTLKYESQWRLLIADIRQIFFGELIYAASWDEYRQVPFWDALDAIGIDFYAPITKRETASRMEMLAGWQFWLNRLQICRRLVKHDIIFTEIGYPSTNGAGMHPEICNLNDASDYGEQADLYWAALQTLGDKDWIRGVSWWNWTPTGSAGTHDKNYTPRGKPAERELAEAWK